MFKHTSKRQNFQNQTPMKLSEITKFFKQHVIIGYSLVLLCEIIFKKKEDQTIFIQVRMKFVSIANLLRSNFYKLFIASCRLVQLADLLSLINWSFISSFSQLNKCEMITFFACVKKDKQLEERERSSVFFSCISFFPLA